MSQPHLSRGDVTNTCFIRDEVHHFQLEALWTAALVRFIRCFASGKRFGLKIDILNLMLALMERRG